ncbi:MAG: amidase [Alphaproteobacteria bacterium]|nr:amidase [Alphaproteobacteria bacterium]
MHRRIGFKFFALTLPALALLACSPAEDRADEPQAQAADYTPHGLLAKPLPEIAAALQSGEVTSEALVGDYLKRIDEIDRAGPTLQSILALNPDALEEARALDAKRAAGEVLGALHGIPVLLKDNIETKDNIATTAGALALKDNITGRDSPLAAGLREAGAIILGKTNLSQWANFRSNNSMSGWSALGGQVRNPHMLDRNPCGSSSGTGAAIAASLAAGGVGTETNGSVICPSNVNGVVGFKPTVGLVPQQYIVPISSSQDTAGPMTKTVTGAAMMLNAMASGAAKTDYVAALDADALSGARIGVLRYAQGSNTAIITHFNSALADLEAAGAILVEITEFDQQNEQYWNDAYAVLEFEFKATINDYLADAAPAVTTRTLEQLIAFNEANADIELALFDQSIFVESEAKAGLEDPDYIAALTRIQSASRENGIDALLAQNQVDILVAPSGPVAPRIDPINGDIWPDWAGAGGLAAIAGYPHLTVPMGTVHGVPVGFSFIGAKDTDAMVLSYGYAYEQKTHHRAEPQYLKDAEAREEIASAMQAK